MQLWARCVSMLNQIWMLLLWNVVFVFWLGLKLLVGGGGGLFHSTDCIYWSSALSGIVDYVWGMLLDFCCYFKLTPRENFHAWMKFVCSLKFILMVRFTLLLLWLLSSLFFLFVFSSMRQQEFTYILGYILKELLCDRMAPVHLKSGNA